MTAGAEDIQCLPVTEENGILGLTDDHLGAETQVADSGFRKMVDDLIRHLARIFNNIKNTCHWLYSCK